MSDTSSPPVAEPETIWLSPKCDGDERSWCADPVYETCSECGAGFVKYVLASRLEEAASALIALQSEVDRCHARLEIDHYFKIGDNDDSDLERVEVPMAERASLPDAVDARDETIKLLEEQLASRKGE